MPLTVYQKSLCVNSSPIRSLPPFQGKDILAFARKVEKCHSRAQLIFPAIPIHLVPNEERGCDTVLTLATLRPGRKVMHLSSQREDPWPPARKYQDGGLSPIPRDLWLYLCSADTLIGLPYSHGETGTFQQPMRPAPEALVMDVVNGHGQGKSGNAWEGEDVCPFSSLKNLVRL